MLADLERQRRKTEQKNNQSNDGPGSAHAIEGSPAIHQRGMAETEDQEQHGEDSPLMLDENRESQKRNSEAS